MMYLVVVMIIITIVIISFTPKIERTPFVETQAENNNSYPGSVYFNFISVHGCVGDHDFSILNSVTDGMEENEI